MEQWYLLIHRIPPRPLYLRAKIRQQLARIGAVALKNSVYVLPKKADALEDFEWVAEEIRSSGGEAHVFDGTIVAGIDDPTLIDRFRAASNAGYESLAAEVRTALKAARGAAGVAALAAEHGRLGRRLEEMQRTDFFDAPRRAAVEELLAKMETRMRTVRREETRMIKANPELHGKIWVTRPGVKIDRIASAWFIRRFVDGKARFRFVDPSTPRAAGELRFDMVGGDFTHEEDRCTFETLVRRVGLPDRGVRTIAEIVHDIDLKDEKFGRPEVSGVRKLLEGLLARHEDDAERLEHGFTIFDDLHEALRPRSRGSRS